MQEVLTRSGAPSASVAVVQNGRIAYEKAYGTAHVGPPAVSLGFRIQGNRSVYFAGDTGLFPEMADIGRSGIDVALLPVAGWGARLDVSCRKDSASPNRL